MHLTDGLDENFQTFGEGGVVLVVPLLVAHTEELQVEGLWMSHVGAQLCPFVGGGVAVGKINQVDAVIDVGL